MLAELRTKLEEKVQINQDRINSTLQRCASNEKLFDLSELSDDLILCARKANQSRTRFQIGFPFPLEQYEGTHGLVIPDNLEVTLFLRGEEIRTRQRGQLFAISDKTEIIETAPALRERVKSAFGTGTKITYIDPYTFIGDGYIGLYFLDKFREQFGTESSELFSDSASHLNTFYPAAPRDIKSICATVERSKHVVMPDLIDTHWPRTLEVINAIRERKIDADIAIPGRSLLVTVKEGKICTHWHKSADVLLRNKNIQDYMDDTLEAFAEPTNPRVAGFKRPQSFTLYVNPFGSLPEKEIPAQLAYLVYRELGATTQQPIQLNIVAGYYTPPHTENGLEILWNFYRLTQKSMEK